MVLLLAASSHDGVADDATNPKTTIHPELIEVRNLTGLRWDRSMLESIRGDRHPKVVALDQRIRRTELLPEKTRPTRSRPFLEMSIEELKALRTVLNARLTELQDQSSNTD